MLVFVLCILAFVLFALIKGKGKNSGGKRSKEEIDMEELLELEDEEDEQDESEDD